MQGRNRSENPCGAVKNNRLSHTQGQFLTAATLLWALYFCWRTLCQRHEVVSNSGVLLHTTVGALFREHTVLEGV
jgi:hypothetical protein